MIASAQAILGNRRFQNILSIFFLGNLVLYFLMAIKLLQILTQNVKFLFGMSLIVQLLGNAV